MEILTGFKPKTTCSIEGCNLPIECKGVCNAHYQRFKLYGRYETVVWGQSSHSLYNMWNERKNKSQLCEEWIDFKKFLIGVGERPEGNYRMGRKNKTKPFGPDNFFWKLYLKRKEGETKNQHASRRRSEDVPRYKGYELKKSFGITYDDFYIMLKTQNFVCKICKEPEKVKHHISGKLKDLAVDHCHKTNKVRGLLCQRCNRVLGKVRDSIKLLDQMKDYLNEHS